MSETRCGLCFSKLCCIPQRVVLSLFGFLAIVNAYTMRNSLSIAITRLAKAQNRTNDTHSVCPAEGGVEFIPGGDYDWDEKLQGAILSSFYIGYIITHVPGGLLADRFGGKWTLGLGLFSTAVLTILTPLVIVTGGAAWLILLRIMMGLGEGTTFPALSVLISAWIPQTERGLLGALILGGGQIGTILGNGLSGVLIDRWGWQCVFYFYGLLGLLWFIFFSFMCYSSPQLHPYIKQSELEYLEREIPVKQHLKTPWKAIFSNVPMYALISAQIGHDWGFYIMVSDLPKYMAQVMQFKITSNGYYSSLPYLMMWIISIVSGFIADILIAKEITSTTKIRKIMTAIASFCPAAFMVAASYAGCNRVAVVILFTICMGTMGAYYAGMKLSPIDMSPNFSGVLMAISNGIGAITGVLTPFVVGVIAPNATLYEWRLVFWIAFVIFCITAIIYCIWASGEVQPFNDMQSDDNANQPKNK